MSDIIDFLEKMGADAQLRGASAIELEAAFIRAGLGSISWTAMLGMNQSRLESLLGARSSVCSLVYAPDQEEEEEGEEKEEEEDEEEDAGKGKADKVKSQDREPIGA